ncbi:MAG: hypothetical protein AAB646_01395 [Patescibacteria group bacterium]
MAQTLSPWLPFSENSKIWFFPITIIQYLPDSIKLIFIPAKDAQDLNDDTVGRFVFRVPDSPDPMPIIGEEIIFREFRPFALAVGFKPESGDSTIWQKQKNTPS